MHTGKIHDLQDLADLCSRLQQEGKQIAHCHGAFDLLHPGHVRHLQAARNMADVLVVTLTEDRFIRKGPGRPVFNERLRLETVAAIHCVDFVAISPWPTAVETLKLIKPNLYVKGQDYRNRAADVTGAVVEEERIVQANGGQLVFTDEIQFSSTKLLNRHFGVFSGPQLAYLSSLRESFTIGDVFASLDALKSLKVLVVGEAIVEECHYCRPDAMNNRTPTISARFESADVFAGGVDAVGQYLAGLAGSVHVLAGVGADGYDMALAGSNGDIHLRSILRRDAPTVRKQRFVHRKLNQKLFELTFVEDRPLGQREEAQTLAAIDELAPVADVVIAIDYGHGFFTPAIVERLRENSRFLAVGAQINASNRGFNTIRKYQAPDYISADENEVRLPFGDRYGALEDLIRKLTLESKCNKINVALETGETLYHHGNSFFNSPVLTEQALHGIDSGDDVLGITALLVSNLAPPEMIPFISSCLFALRSPAIGKRRPVSNTDLKKFITTLLT